MKNKIIILLTLLPILTNCASDKIIPLSQNDSSIISGKTIAIIHGETPSFMATTPKNMTFALLTGGIAGAAMMVHNGNKIVKNNQIEDPSYLIARNLSNEFKSKYNAQIIDKGLEEKTSNNIDKISEQYRNVADYALDVNTAGWGIIYIRFNVNHYITQYGTRLRLIDLKNARIIAEGSCHKTGSKREIENPPTYDELLNDNAKILKEELTNAAIACTNLYKETALTVK